jgi:tetratricopeptide (TPR) repeat protein
VDYRRRLSLTQEELASRTGLSERTIRRLEAGEGRMPRPGSVRLLADAFGLTGEERDAFMVEAKPSAAPAEAHAAAPPTPAQLPADVRGFVGRHDVLGSLNRLLPSRAGAKPDAVTVVTISGMGGVGKTTLAVHWAHQVRDRFPDGQLYVSLRGYDAGQRVDPADALGGALVSLGVPAPQIPTDMSARAAMFRTVLDGKHMLVILDNARDADQVRPLLPGARTIMLVITSRDRLTGLVAAVGAHPLHLEVLTPTESHDLLRSRIGPQRVLADPDAVARIVTACAGLPLALTITAARAQQAAFPLPMIAAELTEATGHLDLLDGGDLAGPGTVFSWSYQGLSDLAAELFRLLGLHPGPDVTVAAAASLAGRSVTEVRRDLRELHRASLVTEHCHGRFAMHDLVRAFARDCAHRTDTETTRRTAVTRLLDYYVHTSRQVSRILHLAHLHPTPDAALPGVVDTPMPNRHDAAAWMVAEREVLLACVRQAANLAMDRHVCHLAYQAQDLLDRQARLDDLWHTTHLALASAERLGDPVLRGYAHRGIAFAQVRRRRFDEALTELDRGRRLFEAVGDTRGRCFVHWSLAIIHAERGAAADALADSTVAQQLAVQVGDPRLRAGTLNLVGMTYLSLSDPRRALEHLELALALSRTASLDVERHILDSLARAYRLLGRHTEAITYYLQALDEYELIDDRRGTGMVLVGLGDTYAATGDHNAARTAWQQALGIYRALNHPDTDAINSRLAKG